MTLFKTSTTLILVLLAIQSQALPTTNSGKSDALPVSTAAATTNKIVEATDATKTKATATKKDDVDEVEAIQLLKIDKSTAMALKLLAMLEDEDKQGYAAIDDESDEDEKADEEFDAFLMALLESMDDENPYVLHKNTLLNRFPGLAQSSTGKRGPSKSKKHLQPVDVETSEEDVEEQAVTSTSTVSPKEEKAAGGFLRTNMKAPGVAAASSVRTEAVQPSEQNSGLPSASILVFGLVSSVIALVLSIIAIIAFCSVAYAKRSPIRRPLSLPLSPKLPLFSPGADGKDVFSMIYNNRSFKFPKRKRQEAEEAKSKASSSTTLASGEPHQIPQEVDEAHYDMNDPLNCSLSSI